jgi:hypothetical protein
VSAAGGPSAAVVMALARTALAPAAATQAPSGRRSRGADVCVVRAFFDFIDVPPIRHCVRRPRIIGNMLFKNNSR